MGTILFRLIFFICISFLVNFSFAQKTSEKLPLPKELQNELPWFALVAKDEAGTYNGVLTKDKVKAIAAQRKSKRVVLSFFATWCIPCREGLARMNKKAAELEKNGVLVVLVNVGEDDYGKVSKWVSGYAKNEWLLGFDKFNNVPENFGLKHNGEMPLPRTLILDPDLRPLMLIGDEGDDFPNVAYP
ncbi:MAG: redoxin domain-containing protein [Fibromonadaceae bacterium]|nr:redoxin domain-containing protein [Fibromonadaceae bacterium]